MIKIKKTQARNLSQKIKKSQMKRIRKARKWKF